MSGGVWTNQKDENFSGLLNTAVSCGPGTLLGVNSTPKLVLPVITSGSSMVPARGMAITSGTAGDRITLIRQGKVEGFTGLTAGSTYYNAGSGSITATRPSVGGQLIQAIGFAISSSVLVLHIDDNDNSRKVEGV